MYGSVLWVFVCSGSFYSESRCTPSTDTYTHEYVDQCAHTECEDDKFLKVVEIENALSIEQFEMPLPENTG